MNKILLAIVLLHSLNEIYTKKIVFIGVIGSKSHKIGYAPIAEALAAKGHHVTVVSPFPSDKSVDNLREIIVPDTLRQFPPPNFFEIQKQNPLLSIGSQFALFSKIASTGFGSVMDNEQFQQITRDRDVDLFVIDCLGNDFILPVIDQLKVPFVLYSPVSVTVVTNEMFDIPAEYASIPSILLDYDTNMNFFQRVANVISSEMMAAARSFLMQPIVDAIVQERHPGVRSLAEIGREASLCLMNHHPTTAHPRPLPPNVIPIGPLHVRPAQPLVPELKKIADESPDGFVVFSLGSFIAGSSLPEHILQAFIQVFSRLPQRVFWKWEKEAKADFPPNVVPLDWLPQQDLLGHPKCRLLISHGGLLGIQEAIYHGVPLLGLPFGNDHHGNIAKAKSEGYALRLEWNRINEHNLYEAISTLISDPSYRTNATRLSNLLRDEMLPAKDAAVYWIEHVMRHGGAKHLQLSSRYLPFYQKHLLDVWLFLFAVVSFVTFVLYTSARCTWSFICKRRKVKTQ